MHKVRKIAPRENNPLAALFSAIAAQQRAILRHAGMRIGGSTVVHEVVELPWFGGQTIPAPRCRAPVKPDMSNITPAVGVVTCGNCLKGRGVTPRLGPVSGHQLSLFD